MHLHFDWRTLQSQLKDGRPPLHNTDECFFKEMGESLGRDVALVHVLQLLPGSQELARKACDGSGDHGSGVGDRGTPGLTQRDSSEGEC